MTIFGIYIIGFYLTMLIYGLLLENSLFRGYLENMCDIYKKNKKCFNKTHSYTLILMFCFAISLLSYAGLIVLFALVIDFLTWKIKNNLK